MYKVKVQSVCACFKKSGFPEIGEYETEEEAKKEADSMLYKMNNDFCHKHEFKVQEKFGDFTIFMQMRS